MTNIPTADTTDSEATYEEASLARFRAALPDSAPTSEWCGALTIRPRPRAIEDTPEIATIEAYAFLGHDRLTIEVSDQDALADILAFAYERLTPQLMNDPMPNPRQTTPKENYL